MKKRRDELTVQEEEALTAEIARIFIFGSACTFAAAENAHEDTKGWPPISITSGVDEIQVSLCDVLEVLHESSNKALTHEIAGSLFGFLVADSPEEVERLATHDAMHSAFCFGIAASTLLEMDFSGVEEVVARITQEIDNE